MLSVWDDADPLAFDSEIGYHHHHLADSAGINPPGNVCKNCGKTYKFKKLLIRHYTYECLKNPRFMCSYCLKKSKRRENLISHIRNMHPGFEIAVIDTEANTFMY